MCLPNCHGPWLSSSCYGLITGDTPWALKDATYFMAEDTIRCWCPIGSAICVSVYLTAMGHVQLPCCNGVITGDTQWALGNANYHLTGSYFMAEDKIRCWCPLWSAVCVSTQLPWALAVQPALAMASSRGTHHGHLGMPTTTSQAPSTCVEIRFDVEVH